MNDFSFIRLDQNFEKAKSENIPAIANIGYFDQIQLHPKETYLQITNTVEGIAFDGNFAVYVIDCEGKELKNITENTAIFEFTDNKGKQQIAFEIAYINADFYKRTVFLKFVHTVSDYIWYSNAITISEYQINQTTRFDYRGFSDYYGIAYNRANYFQSIRLKCRFEVNDVESSSSKYTSINGVSVTSRMIQTEFEKYIFEGIDNFTYRRINKLLGNSVIYINGNRMTDKVTVASDDRIGNTNIYDVNFKAAINYSDTFTLVFQIHEPLTLIDYSPFGNHTLLSLPNDINGQFNRNITELTGTIKLIDNSDDSVIHTFTETTITTALNLITADITGLILANGSYKVVVSSGLFLSDLGEIFNGFEWNFTVSSGDFLNTDFNNIDFFTN